MEKTRYIRNTLKEFLHLVSFKSSSKLRLVYEAGFKAGETWNNVVRCVEKDYVDDMNKCQGG